MQNQKYILSNRELANSLKEKKKNCDEYHWNLELDTVWGLSSDPSYLVTCLNQKENTGQVRAKRLSIKIPVRHWSSSHSL